MKKLCTTLLLVFSLVLSGESYIWADEGNSQDSRELELQDMLVLLLLPHMELKLKEIYSPYLTQPPGLYPYFVDVLKVERSNGFRGFDFLITLEAVPTVGPHIPAGKDRFTYRISPLVPQLVQLEQFQHVKGPARKDFPPNYVELLKQ